MSSIAPSNLYLAWVAVLARALLHLVSSCVQLLREAAMLVVQQDLQEFRQRSSQPASRLGCCPGSGAFPAGEQLHIAPGSSSHANGPAAPG